MESAMVKILYGVKKFLLTSDMITKISIASSGMR